MRLRAVSINDEHSHNHANCRCKRSYARLIKVIKLCSRKRSSLHTHIAAGTAYFFGKTRRDSYSKIGRPQGVEGGVKNHPPLRLFPPPLPLHINAPALIHALHIFYLPLPLPLPWWHFLLKRQSWWWPGHSTCCTTCFEHQIFLNCKKERWQKNAPCVKKGRVSIRARAVLSTGGGRGRRGKARRSMIISWAIEKLTVHSDASFCISSISQLDRSVGTQAPHILRPVFWRIFWMDTASSIFNIQDRFLFPSCACTMKFQIVY